MGQPRSMPRPQGWAWVSSAMHCCWKGAACMGVWGTLRGVDAWGGPEGWELEARFWTSSSQS